MITVALSEQMCDYLIIIIMAWTYIVLFMANKALYTNHYKKEEKRRTHL